MSFPAPVVCALALSAAALMPAAARATVSGFHDRAAQIGVILSSDAVAEALRQAPVKSLEFEGTRADGGLRWEIESSDCEVDVVLKATPPQGAGAVRYAIAEVGRCR